MKIDRPASTEYAPFYAGYVGKVSDSGPLALLESQLDAFRALGGKAASSGDYRYAEGKWTVKDLLGHVADTERVFAYRLLRIARNDAAPLAGFDEKAWSQWAPHAGRPLGDIIDELLALRRSTLYLVRSLDASALARRGVANGKDVTVRALCWIIPGHVQHHLDVLRDRYGL
jgi:hypothetical protein